MKNNSQQPATKHDVNELREDLNATLKAMSEAMVIHAQQFNILLDKSNSLLATQNQILDLLRDK